jgi:energy-converting hydrogenase Eha subunit C
LSNYKIGHFEKVCVLTRLGVLSFDQPLTRLFHLQLLPGEFCMVLIEAGTAAVMMLCCTVTLELYFDKIPQIYKTTSVK